MQELACGYGLHPTDFWALPLDDLFTYIRGNSKAEQREWERARFIASGFTDTSSHRFSWEKPLRQPSKRIDKEKLERLKKADQEILKRLGQI